MEIFRKKNEATIICFPMVTTASPEAFDTGETVADTAYYSDAEGVFTTLAITDTVAEISTTGMYEISLTAAEMNHDLIIIKFTSTNAADTAVLIRTRAVDLDDLVRSTTPANALDVSAAGEAGIDWANIGSPTTAQNLSGTNIDVDQVIASVSGNVADVTNLSNLPTIPANWITVAGITDGAFTAAKFAASSLDGKGNWNVGKTGYSLTVADWNVGKTGYALTTADWNVGKTGYALAVTPPTAAQIRSEIDANSTAFASLLGGIIEGATSGTPSTTSTDTDLTGYADGELEDRVIVFTGGTADGQAATILTYTATNGVVTFAALTTAPAASDPFKIV